MGVCEQMWTTKRVPSAISDALSGPLSGRARFPRMCTASCVSLLVRQGQLERRRLRAQESEKPEKERWEAKNLYG
jgi:hypothetical protein